jgi:nucleotide-binding universal stress UspA family protein
VTYWGNRGAASERGGAEVGDAGTVTDGGPPRLAVVDVGNVLVPLDGSELALQALPTARVLAGRLGAELHTVTVADGVEGAERARALGAAALGVPVGDPRVFVVTEGDPEEVILVRAGALGSCLVCMATHGRGRLQGALVGSVARSLLQLSVDPIVALGPVADNPGWSPRPRSWPEPLSVPRIVACVDGSETSEQVLPLAAAWAHALGMSLTILTVVADESALAGRRDDQRYIERLVEEWRQHLPDTGGDVVRDPIGPANGVRLHLEQRPAGLVALTSSARSGMQRLTLGAAAAGIVRASVAPCLVAPVRR